MDTFNSKYSTWYSPLNQLQIFQYKQLEKLVLSFNANMKGDVIRAKDKYNLKVRGVIAEKTGFSLNCRNKENNTRELFIPIKIVDRVPTSLLNLFDNYNISQIELLLHYREMKHSVEELEYHKIRYSSFSNLHHEVYKISDLENSIKYLNDLIKVVDDSGILNDIQELGPDLLGAYFLRDNRVELYWLCIGLCSILHDISIEDFTLVVLTHELVHGYTHIGFDKDGNNWDTSNFGSTDLVIVEGFAQFYTEMLCNEYFEQATNAFKALLTKQSVEYTEYLNWFDVKERDKYEKARRILLKSRKNPISTYEDFEKNLKLIKKDF